MNVPPDMAPRAGGLEERRSTSWQSVGQGWTVNNWGSRGGGGGGEEQEDRDG